MRLHDRALSFAMPAFWRMARHFQRLDGMPPALRLRHPSFMTAMEKLVCRKDLAARVWLKACRVLQPVSANAPPTL
jgi:uncharacterized protein YecE (DUF72 family)